MNPIKSIVISVLNEWFNDCSIDYDGISKEHRESEHNVEESYEDIGMDYILYTVPKLDQRTDYDNKKVIGNFTYLNFNEVDNYSKWFVWGNIYVYDNTDGTEVANSSYGKQHEWSELRPSIDVRPDKRRLGIASNIYQWIEELVGEILHPDKPHSPSAEKLWANPKRKFGLERVVNEVLNEFIIDEDINSDVKRFLYYDKDSVNISFGSAHAELQKEQLEDGELSLYISEIYDDNKGSGNAALLIDKLMKFSDVANMPLSLRASVNNTIKTNKSSALSQEQLIKAYQRMGFRFAEELNNFPSDSTAPFMVYNY